jgi:hypothetical protein
MYLLTENVESGGKMACYVGRPADRFLTIWPILYFSPFFVKLLKDFCERSMIRSVVNFALRKSQAPRPDLAEGGLV